MATDVAIRDVRELGARPLEGRSKKLGHGKTWMLGAIDLLSLTLG